MSTLKKPAAGDPLLDVLDAPTLGAFVDAARFARGQAGSRNAGSARAFRQAGIIKIKNDSGEDRNRFDILGIDEPIIAVADSLETWKNEVQLKGVVPDIAKHQGKFVILLEPLAKDGIGRAFISGACSCQVFVDDANHQFAEVEDEQTSRLRSTQFGSAKILWKETGTGLLWADVRLGNLPPRSFLPFELTTALDPTSSASARLLEWNGSDFDMVGDVFGVQDDLYTHPLGVNGRRNVHDATPAGARGLFFTEGSDNIIATLTLGVARWIRFSVDDAFASGDGTVEATVQRYWDGSDPGADVTLKNEDGDEGAQFTQGFAIHDGSDYTIISMAIVHPP